MLAIACGYEGGNDFKKIAGRIVETASRIRVALASCCTEAELFSLLAFQLQKSGPSTAGHAAPGAQTINRQRVNGVPALNQSADGDLRGRRSLFISIRRSMACAEA